MLNQNIASIDQIIALRAALNERLVFGLSTNRPTASTSNNGYYWLDETGIYNSNGTTWSKVGYTKADVDALIVAVTDINRKIYYASPTGLSTNTGNTPNTAVDFATALTKAGNSGNQVCVLPGTYAGDFTINQLNVTITSANMERGGLCNFSGILTIANASSSIRLAGITAATINHTGAGGLYMFSCKTNTAFSSTGGGYLEMEYCDTQGVSLTGTTTLSGGGIKNFFLSYVGFPIISGTTIVRLSNNITVSPINITGGTLAIGGENPVYSATGTSNAITATAPGGLGTTVLVFDGLTALTPTNTQARISIGTNVVYGIRRAVFDKANSTLTGTNSSQSLITDFIDAQSATSSQKGLLTAADWSTFNSSATTVSAATSSNTANTIIKRDSSGNFIAGTITATLSGNSSNVTATSNSTLSTLSALSLPVSQLNGTLPISSGGTGKTTASSAFNALSPITSTGDIIVGNGTNSATRLAIGSFGQSLGVSNNTPSWMGAFISPAIFNVFSYGAVGDGTTDDTTAIQNAINSAQSFSSKSNQAAATLYAPAGYLFKITSGLTINKPIKIVFDSFIIYAASNGTAITIGSSSPTQGNQAYDMVFTGLYQSSSNGGNTNQPNSINSSGAIGFQVNSLCFSRLRVDAIQGFTKIGMYLNGLGDVYSGQVIQHNLIELGQVVNCGLGLKLLSLDAATSSAEANTINILNIYQCYTCIQVDDSSHNASTSNTFNIYSMDDSAVGGGLLMYGQWNYVYIGYTGTSVVMGSNSGYNVVFIANNFSTSATVSYGGSNNKITTALPATNQIPVGNITVTDSTPVQNNYGVKISVYLSALCNSGASVVVKLGPTSTPAYTILNPANTSPNAIEFPLTINVPPGWYWEVIKSGSVSYSGASYIPE